jgi:hypothetical protein
MYRRDPAQAHALIIAHALILHGTRSQAVPGKGSRLYNTQSVMSKSGNGSLPEAKFCVVRLASQKIRLSEPDLLPMTCL